VPPKPSLNVSLTPHLEQFIAASVASGRYQTASEVVRAGLRLLENFESDEPQSGTVRDDPSPDRRGKPRDGKALPGRVGGDGLSAGAKKGTGAFAKAPRDA
jgi:putative addiction module CopG family antidote